MGTTPNLGLPYPELSDTPDVPRDIRALAMAIDQAQVRVRRPNGDDRVVEVWNGSAWSVVDYDSGWRNIDSLITADARAKIATWDVARMRITLDTVQFVFRGGIGSGSAAGTSDGFLVAHLPTDMAAVDFVYVGMGNAGYGTSPFGVNFSADQHDLAFSAPPGGGPAALPFSVGGQYARLNRTIPNSLPGTAAAPAPAAAPPPDAPEVLPE
jgi:hypothetical protein